MAANIIDLAVGLIQVSPQIMPLLVEKYLTPEQKKSLQTIQQPRAKHPLLTTSRSQVQRLQPQHEQNLLDTLRSVPQQDLQNFLLRVAKESDRQAKETALFVHFFMIICLIALVISIILFLFVPAVGGALTAISGFLSVVGKLISNTHKESIKTRNDLIDKLQNLQLN